MSEQEEDNSDEPKTEPEQLQEAIAIVKNQITETNQIFDKAKTLVKNIETYFSGFEILKTKLDNPETGLESVLTLSKSKKDEIEKLKKESEENLATIKTSINDVSEAIKLMEATYEKFQVSNKKISDPATGLDAILASALALKTKIEEVKNSSDTHLSTIKTNLDSINKNIGLMNATYTEFQQIKNKIDDKDTGLVAILTNSEGLRQDIEALKNQSGLIFKEITQFRDESRDYHKAINEFKSTSEVEAKAIQKLHEESEDYKSKISKIYKLATDTGLANSFESRKKELNIGQYVWLAVFVASTIALALVVYNLFKPVFEGNYSQINSYTWYRLTITSPLLLLVAFASTQYSRERNLLERYAFKSATAFALESYTTLLTNTFDREKNQDKILEFVLRSMRTIYEEPYEPIKESKWSFGVDGKSASLKAELSQKMDDATKKVSNKVESEAKKVVDAVKEEAEEIKN